MGSRHFWIESPAFEAAALKAQIQYEKDVDEYVKKTQEKRYRVWIELDKPVDDEHAEELCALANKMLSRLNESSESQGGFSWSPNEHRYMFSHGGHTYKYLADNGEWFNLEYFGRND